jgi:hypothetical protein
LNRDSISQGKENNIIPKNPKKMFDIAASRCSDEVANPALKLAIVISKISIAKKMM